MSLFTVLATSKVAAGVLAAGTLAVGGTGAAAASGVLPTEAQQAAHELFGAPAPKLAASAASDALEGTAGAAATDSVFLVAQHYYGRTRTLPMRRLTLTTAEATVPADMLYPGLLRYWLVVKQANKSTTFPGNHPGTPRDWE